jgi:hypothetical protein
MDYSANGVYNLSFIVAESVKMEKPIIAVSVDCKLSIYAFSSPPTLYYFISFFYFFPFHFVYACVCEKEIESIPIITKLTWQI